MTKQRHTSVTNIDTNMCGLHRQHSRSLPQTGYTPLQEQAQPVVSDRWSILSPLVNAVCAGCCCHEYTMAVSSSVHPLLLQSPQHKSVAGPSPRPDHTHTDACRPSSVALLHSQDMQHPPTAEVTPAGIHTHTRDNSLRAGYSAPATPACRLRQ